MSNMMKELFFADAIYHKDTENYTEMNTDLVDKILQWRRNDPEGVKISNSLGWQSKSIMQNDKDTWKDLLKRQKETQLQKIYRLCQKILSQISIQQFLKIS